MKRPVHMLSFAVLSLLCAATAAGDTVGAKAKLFVACPIYRDTDAGRKSGCWLADDPASGLRYDVTGARVKPILGRKILVEGFVTEQDTGACGGVVLEPVSVSVLEQDCKEFLLPAEGHAGRRFVLPESVMQPTSVPRTLPPPPYEPREFTIQFELNSDFLMYQYAEMIIERAVLYAKASKPRRVTITGYAATRGTKVSDALIREDLSIAQARARMVAEAFERLGIQRELLQLKWHAEPPAQPPAEDGLTEAAKRRAVIRIDP